MKIDTFDMKKIIFAAILLMVSMSGVLFSQASFKIYNPSSFKDTVDMGMCLTTDELSTTFIIENTGTTRIRILGFSPCFILGTDPEYPDEFREFYVNALFFPINLEPQQQYELIIKYKPQYLYSDGTKHAILRIGAIDPDVVTWNPLDSDLITKKIFFLIARKSKFKIHGYDELINFDSVYVNPPNVLHKIWKVQNSSDEDLFVDTSRILYTTPIIGDTEIKVQIQKFPISFPKHTSVDWDMSYYPINRGLDNVNFEVRYYPDSLNPDAFQYAVAFVRGFGIEQQLNIASASCNFSNDTILLGDVKIKETKEFLVNIQNNGNLPFGALSQNIYFADKNEIDTNFAITQLFLKQNNHLIPKDYDSIKIEFKPVKRGETVSRIVLQSDIFKRKKVSGAVPSVEFVTFYIKANAIESELNLAKDTIDFGNIVIDIDCPTRRDTVIKISNLGNATLFIKDIYLSPPPPSAFSITPRQLEINKFSDSTIKISFSSENQTLDIYRSKLVFVSNSTSPKDTIIMNLVATGIEPISAKISIPQDIKSKPGSKIKIPIIVEKNRVNLAKTFSDTLVYDYSLLQYFDYNTIGTASESSQFFDIKEIDNTGKLSIQITNSLSNNFLNRDTLIELVFYSYLGEKISTPVAFQNPKFGDGICSKVLTPKLTNGVFTLDSVCGLEFKVGPLRKSSYYVENPSPNPATENINIKFNLALAGETTITFFNSFGDAVKKIKIDKLPAGFYEHSFSVSELPAGVYFMEFKSRLFKDTKTLIRTR